MESSSFQAKARLWHPTFKAVNVFRGAVKLDQIEAFERAGFVMSGSRHGRMDAVRTRKEHQVISAEQRQSQLSQKRLDRARKEAEIIHQFRDMVDTMQQQPTN